MAPIVNMLRAVFATLFLTVNLAADVHAQSQVARVGVIPSGSAAKTARFIDVFRQRLQELGYVEGRNIAVELRYPGEHTEGYREAAAELVALKVDVIVAASTAATRAARQQTSTIPIVMVGVADAVLAGFAQTLARPGGNATGQSFLGAELHDKGFDLLTEALPRVKRIAMIYDPAIAIRDPPEFKNVRTAAQAKGVTIVPVRVRRADDLSSALAAMAETPPGALHVFAVRIAEQPQIADFAAKHRIPAICSFGEAVDAGALMTYGPNFFEFWRGAASYVDKILKGAKPADLPVEQPAAFEMVINLKTAKALGITLPPSVLARADRLIQ
jgi:putative ABC transport system substrate-binding protein